MVDTIKDMVDNNATEPRAAFSAKLKFQDLAECGKMEGNCTFISIFYGLEWRTIYYVTPYAIIMFAGELYNLLPKCLYQVKFSNFHIYL